MITRDSQKADHIYVIEGTGRAFVSPDGEGRVWFYRDYYRQELDMDAPADVAAKLDAEDDDDEAAVIVARAERYDVTGTSYIDPSELED